MEQMNAAWKAIPVVWLLVLFVVQANAQVPPGNGGLYRWDGNSFVEENGYGVRIAVAPNGEAWVVNAAGEIFRQVGKAFQKVDGSGRDIAVAGDGTPWVVGVDDRVYRLIRNNWEPVPDTAASAIAAGRRDDVWVANARGEIYRWNGRGFQVQPGGARDIGVAGNSVWLVGTDSSIYEVQRNGKIVDRRGMAARIAVAGSVPWVVTDKGDIYRWRGTSFEQVPGSASDIGANARGDVWVIGRVQGTSQTPAQPGRGRARGRP